MRQRRFFPTFFVGRLFINGLIFVHQILLWRWAYVCSSTLLLSRFERCLEDSLPQIFVLVLLLVLVVVHLLLFVARILFSLINSVLLQARISQIVVVKCWQRKCSLELRLVQHEHFRANATLISRCHLLIFPLWVNLTTLVHLGKPLVIIYAITCVVVFMVRR